MIDYDADEDEALKDILKENKASQPSKSLEKIKEDIACVDVHRVLSGNPEMQEVSVKLYQHLVNKGLSENEALAILGNSLIKIHENPFAVAQPAALQLAVGAVTTAIEACAANPACVNLVALTLTGAFAAGKIITEGFDAAEEIDTTMWTPEHNYKSQDEEFLADTTVNNIPGFDWEQYANNDESFTIPEGIDMSVLAKVEIKDGRIVTEKFKLRDSEGGAHGGHSEERHVGKSGEYLKGRNLPEATTFPDYKTANEAVKEVLKHNNDDIVKWAESAKERETLPITKVFDNKIGHGITKNGIKFDSNKVKVVLVKIGKEVEVLTSYPVK